MLNSQKQCKGCVFWKKASATGGTENSLHACHHLLETGKRRIEKDGKCLSRKTEREIEKENKMPQMVVKKGDGRKFRHSKIMNVETGEVFTNMSEAARSYGASPCAIRQAVNNPQWKCCGFHWKKVD